MNVAQKVKRKLDYKTQLKHTGATNLIHFSIKLSQIDNTT
jgi:hypothetical protein